MKWTWWKILTIVLLIYTIVAGFLVEVPTQPILNETIRNLFFHVCMWFAMFNLSIVSLIYSIMYLINEKPKHDINASAFANTAILFGILGLITGMIWVNYSWNSNPNTFVFWVKEDIKLNAAAMGTIIYAVYAVLRNSIKDEQKQARFSAVYNIFAFVMLMLFTSVIPRLAEASLHPGNAGNPGFNTYDTTDEMKMVFYPAIIGWTLLGVWVANLRVRFTLLKNKLEN